LFTLSQQKEKKKGVVLVSIQEGKTIIKKSVKSPCLHLVFTPSFTPLNPLLVVSAK
jgi:hypothetical protein